MVVLGQSSHRPPPSVHAPGQMRSDQHCKVPVFPGSVSDTFKFHLRLFTAAGVLPISADSGDTGWKTPTNGATPLLTLTVPKSSNTVSVPAAPHAEPKFCPLCPFLFNRGTVVLSGATKFTTRSLS